jgi:UDP-N-acetylmuramyl pentapeptide synthase
VGCGLRGYGMDWASRRVVAVTTTTIAISPDIDWEHRSDTSSKWSVSSWKIEIFTKMADEYDTVIINGVVVTESTTEELDIAIKNEKVVKVSARGSLNDIKATKVIDAEGGYVMVPCVYSYINSSSWPK